MYNVSQAYLTAMKQDTIKRKLRGSINSISFTDADILTGSAMITNKISDGTEIKIGSVNIGELTITFLDCDFVNDWQWATIRIEEGLRLANNTYEYIPMGVFTVSKAERSESGVAITAYDNMSKFDKRYALSTTSGKAYAFLQYICTSCNMTLGMTEQEVQALPNGNTMLGLWTENDIETFRDLLSWVAQTLACYATIDRSGNLVLRPYTSVVTDTLDEYHRYKGDIYSTFETRYSGVSVVDIKSQATMYVGVAPDIYLTYNLGSNPLIQYGTKANKETMLTNIINSLQNVQYTPFNVSLPCGGAYDLGDVIEFEDGYGDCTCCITNYTWQFYGSDNYQARGEGKDPALANARSKTDKNLTGLMSQINANEFQYYIYRNLEAINVGNTQEKEIVSIRFASLTATIVVFAAEILLDIETLESGITYTDAVGKVTYYINNEEITEYHPIETWVDGKHVLHLLYHLNIGDAQLTKFVATLTMNGGSAAIPIQGVQASIRGQGLVATEEWDGYLDFEEEIGEITLGGIEVENNIIDEVEFGLVTPYTPEFEEEIGEITLGGIEVENNMSEELLIDNDFMNQYTHSELSARTHEYYNNMFIYG